MFRRAASARDPTTLQFYGEPPVEHQRVGEQGEPQAPSIRGAQGRSSSRLVGGQERAPIGLDHVRTAALQDCLVGERPADGEEFASVRRPFAWKKGTYTWSVSKGETVDHKGARATWFTCRVRDHAGDRTEEIGSLLFEGEEFRFWAGHSAFVEVYSTEKIPRSNIPKVNVTFGWPRVNVKKAAVTQRRRLIILRWVPRVYTSARPTAARVRADGEVHRRDRPDLQARRNEASACVRRQGRVDTGLDRHGYGLVPVR